MLKIKYKSNFIAGVCSAVFGVVVLLLIPSQVGVDTGKTFGVGSASIPMGMALVCIVCGILLVIKSKVFKDDVEKELEVSRELKIFLYFLVLLAYALTFDYSFVISTCILAVVTLLFTGSRKISYYLISVGMVLLLYVTFRFLLNVNLP